MTHYIYSPEKNQLLPQPTMEKPKQTSFISHVGICAEYDATGYDQAYEAYKEYLATLTPIDCGTKEGWPEGLISEDKIQIYHASDFRDSTITKLAFPLTKTAVVKSEGKTVYTDTEFPGLELNMNGIKEYLVDGGYKGEELEKILKGAGYWACHQISKSLTLLKQENAELQRNILEFKQGFKVLNEENDRVRAKLKIATRALRNVRDFDDDSEYDDPGFCAIDALNKIGNL